MRFDLQPNVMCLLYEHPLLLERPRGWTPKNNRPDIEHPQRPHAKNGGVVTTVEPATTLIAISLEESVWRRSAVP
jgi:hypothetical protein